MTLLRTPEAELGQAAPDFSLKSVDGKTYSLGDIQGEKATLVMFICNHCPYVKAIAERLAKQCNGLIEKGVGVAAICSNDAVNYPDDSFEKMKLFAQEHSFGFPYLCDEDQSAARAFGAVCTPDFFGYDAKLLLAFRGRIDNCVLDEPTESTKPELQMGMLEIAAGKPVSLPQKPSMGCSIKWK